MLQKWAKRTAVLRATWVCKTEIYWTSTEMDVNMLFPDLGQLRSGNIEIKNPLQQHGTVMQVHDSAWRNISCWVQNKSNSEIAGQLTIWVVYQLKLCLKTIFVCKIDGENASVRVRRESCMEKNWLRNTKKYYITSETNPSPILGISELEKVIEKTFPAPLW